MSIELDTKQIEKMQEWLDLMDMPSIAESGKAIVRLYMLDFIQDICEWDKSDGWIATCDSAKEARYWWKLIMDRQGEYETRIGA
jgi:hypothetical protein